MCTSISFKYVNYITYLLNRIRLIYRKFWIFTHYLITPYKGKRSTFQYYLCKLKPRINPLPDIYNHPCGYGWFLFFLPYSPISYRTYMNDVTYFDDCITIILNQDGPLLTSFKIHFHSPVYCLIVF